MNKKSIENLISDAYEDGGMEAACTEANKYSCITYEFCNMCDCKVPTVEHDHGCLICGHETINDPDTEDIPCENDENN